MIKYYNTEVVFEEIPDEVTLAVNITNCRHNCPGCHSAYLREDIGHELNFKAIDELIEKNDGITCFCFMGEGNDPKALKNAVYYLWNKYPKLKIGLYSGGERVDGEFVQFLTYLKVGPYIEELGPLNKETTNQRLYKYDSDYVIEIMKSGKLPSEFDFPPFGFKDITSRFWSKDVRKRD